MKLYSNPVVELIRVNSKDAICTSVLFGGSGNDAQNVVGWDDLLKL